MLKDIGPSQNPGILSQPLIFWMNILQKIMSSGGYRGRTFWQVYLSTSRIHTDAVHVYLPNKMGCLPRRENSVRVGGSMPFIRPHTNRLEMRAVILSLRHSQEVIQEQSLLIATDNTTVVAFLQNQGETHSLSLYLLCREIIFLCESLESVNSATCPGQSESNSGCQDNLGFLFS